MQKNTLLPNRLRVESECDVDGAAQRAGATSLPPASASGVGPELSFFDSDDNDVFTKLKEAEKVNYSPFFLDV